MRTIKIIAASLATTIAAFVVAQNLAPRTPYSDFRIHITTNEKGFELVCEKGCLWGELWVSCGNLPCGSWISENGMDNGTGLEPFGLTPEDLPRPAD